MDIVSPVVRSRIMASIGGVDTKPELMVRRALHRAGYRFRKNVRGMPGTPDVVFSKKRVVIQIFGCFWHQHSCQEGKVPKSNCEFWADKFRKNKSRDRRDIRRLRDLGYLVVVAWECRLERDFAAEMSRIIRLLNLRPHLAVMA